MIFGAHLAHKGIKSGKRVYKFVKVLLREFTKSDEL